MELANDNPEGDSFMLALNFPMPGKSENRIVLLFAESIYSFYSRIIP
jgi:hypothetical protein